MAGATVGITYKFPQRGFKPAPDVDAIMALTSSQMDAINTALAQQIEQNRQLKRPNLQNQPTEVVTEQVTVNQIAPAPSICIFPDRFSGSSYQLYCKFATNRRSGKRQPGTKIESNRLC